MDNVLNVLRNILGSIDFNKLMSDAESALAKKIVSAIIAKFAIPAWLTGPVGWILSIAVGFVVKYGDIELYVLGDSWQNTQDGKSFEEAGNALSKLQKDKAAPEAIAKAKADKMAAFDRLMDAP